MNYEEFFREARSSELVVDFNNVDSPVGHRLSNEALFHLPLLAMTVLLFSSGKTKPKCDLLGQLVGECYERAFVGFKGSSQQLGWSANLRVRTVKALTFLEASMLVKVDSSSSRIAATDKGKKVIAKALAEQTDLAYELRVIERKYKDVQAERQISMGLR